MHLGFRNNIVMVNLFFAKDTVMVYTEELNFGVSKLAICKLYF